MTRFAHISDTHLGYRQYHLKAREEDFYEAFKEAVDKIIEEDVDFLIHSGDLVNRYRSHPKPLKIAADQFKRLKNHDIPTYIVPGNHDIARKSGALPVQSVLSDFTYTLMGGGKRIFKVHDDIFIGGVLYLPATYSKVLKKRITRLTEKARNYDTRILILHQGIRRFS
ncbi:MAG: DNA repair exonuclease, partial [Candidatus Korarchaeota archaeon]|nr:DNA repair exonuclease [Candidatus Korarchaeota archaeon]